MTTLVRWTARLAARRALLSAARTRLTAAERGLAWARAARRPSVAERAHSVSVLRRLVATRESQVAYAARVVARHTAASDLSDDGLALIAKFEGERLRAYHLPGEQFWTIGVGHYGADVRPGETITHARAMSLLHADAQEAVRAVRALGLHLTQGQFDALVSIAFNCGTGILGAHTALGAALRAHDMAAAARAFGLYVHDSRGVVLAGLVARRHAEQDLFRS